MGKKIVHVDETPEELKERHAAFGMSRDYGEMMAVLDTNVKHGAEEITNDVVLSLTGKQPKGFRQWAEENKSVWS